MGRAGRRGRASIRDGLSRALAVTGAASLGACNGVLDPKGPVGQAELSILVNATVIMLAVIVPVIVLTIGFAVWFRAGNRKAFYWPDWEYSGRIEFVVWSIPAMVVLFLAGIGWIGSHLLDPHAPIASDRRPLPVQVIALDWKWLFIYPDQGIASVNRLVVPTGTPLDLRITSATVMNAFFVPQLGSMIYAMAGMTAKLNLQADEAGVFPGLSAMFSGDGFSDMRFDVDARAPDGFQAWVDATRGNRDALDEARYAALARPSVADPPAVFGQVASDLFGRVSGGMTAPAGVPRTDRPDVHSVPRR